MKYWIFQNNQVLGPYEPDEMGKISVFSPESLVCPEGRRGTSMGDWQRAGMVPDLSVALVRANTSGGGKTSVLSISGLPPEPTLKDLAQLGGIQEKVSMLEEVVLRLQEGLRAKGAELASLHQELAGKSREASEIKEEAAARQREAEQLKRQLAGLEERLTSVRLLSETLDKAVEEEKRVEHDVEQQGQTLTDLARDVEELRGQLAASQARQAEFLTVAPLPAVADIPGPSAPAELPTINAKPPPAFEAPSVDPMAFEPPSDAPAPDATPVPALPAPKRKKALVLGAVLVFAVLGGLIVIVGLIPGLRKPEVPVAVLEPAPMPPPEPEPLPVAPPDTRQLAVELAKAWPLPGNRTLERALENLAPSTGNLSPWMADPLAGNRIQVNYFARSSAPGAPTIAYEFEIDLDGKTLVGRNAAAKSVLTGKATAPPAPPKPKRVRVKVKAPPAKKTPAEDDSLDSILNDAPAKGRAAELKNSEMPADKTLLDDLLKE